MFVSWLTYWALCTHAGYTERGSLSFWYLSLDKFCKLAEAGSLHKCINFMAPTKSYYAAYQEYVDISTDLGETQKSLCFQGSQINTRKFHYSVATPIIELLIKEIKETLFDVKKIMSYWCNAPFVMLSTVSMPEIHQHQSIFPSYYGIENIKKIYSLYGQNRMDILEGKPNEQLQLIKAS